MPHDAARVAAAAAHQKTAALRILKEVLEQGDTEGAEVLIRPDCIRRYPLAPDEAAPLNDLGIVLRERFPEARYEVKRVVSEGDLVLIHSHLVTAPGMRGAAVADIFRFQDGKVAEHWRAEQDVPQTTANGNDMFSTRSRPATEASQTACPARDDNKKLVTAYFEQLLVKKDVSAVDRYLAAEYRQHNPILPDGPEGERAGLSAFFDQFPHLTVTPKLVIAEDDLVAVHAHFVNVPGERGQMIADIFRVLDGKIVEHWDVIQDVP
ncbi:nuclear transport factor 2 family protein [Streptomyces olindensis]|uniref:nuclear transport factor 2 family protein n=1 Tax=Streptomyces olindensis TaxID=358823 RepID=UPI00369F20B3